MEGWRQRSQSQQKSRRRMDGCWKRYMLMEVHIEKLKESVGRERLRVQEEGGKDGIRSQRRWEGLALKRKWNPQPSDIRRILELEE